MRRARFLGGMAAVFALAAPAAAQTSKTGPLSGYMDVHFNKVSGEEGVIDFHRFVLLFTHSFTPRIRFVGELELEHAFVEFRAHLGRCKFNDCRHVSEPGCAIAAAMQDGAIHPQRVASYRRLVTQLMRKPKRYA